MTSVLVFVRVKYQADVLARDLRHEGFQVAYIHGDRSQPDRVAALDAFKQKRVQILVATDIASRGLDIEEISHVVNFDLPETGDGYIHRVGRTGRVDAHGDAVSFVCPDEYGSLGDIEDVLGYCLPRVKDPDFDYGSPEELRPSTRGRRRR